MAHRIKAEKNIDGVKGYKMFRHDWTCCPDEKSKQYTCPGIFEMEGYIELGERGMHFCQKIEDCFRYYPVDSSFHVAEVIAHGEVLIGDTNCCTTKLEIIRELTWEEVFRLANTGVWNIGYSNSGNYNNGDFNSGSLNVGNYNVGNYNVGDVNTGDHNTGHTNSGDYNIGSSNFGNHNFGSHNTGHSNTGDHNFGLYNIGDFNQSSFNIGCFNTKTDQCITLFNKPSTWTYAYWMISKAKEILSHIPTPKFQWVNAVDMTAAEKEAHKVEYFCLHGYNRKVMTTTPQQWWDQLSDTDKQIVKAIPNFDAKIFEECTNIHVE